MLPGLLLAAELFVIVDNSHARWRVTRPVWLLQILAAELAVVIRSLVPMETASGTFKAEVFYQSTMWSRFETMLVVVPEWLRLHLWPATLQADYSPRVIDQATGWGGAQWLGLAIVVLIVVLAFRLRSRAPVILFGVAWVAIGLFPVSNVLVPTGITMAERTLFLPSIGAMLAVAAFGVEAIRSAVGRPRQVLQWTFGAAVIVVTILGASRSWSRHRIWRNSMVMWSQTIVDAPQSYRAWVAFGAIAYKMISPERGIHAYKVALQLYDKSEGPILQLAEWYRLRGSCEEAAPLYRQVLALREFAPAMASYTGCLVWEGDYRGAQEMALRGLKTGYYSTLFHVWFRTALAAERNHAPVHTVRFPKGYDYLFDKPTPNGGGLQFGGKLLP